MSMENILIIENNHLCENGCVLTIDWLPLIILVLFPFKLIIILFIYGICFFPQRIKSSSQGHGIMRRDADEETNILHPISIEYNSCLYIGICAASIVEINKEVDQVIGLTRDVNLICYCDGSYSHWEGIGHAGFRASNGFGKTLFFSPDQPNNGSTATEVLAAFLAIEYALKQRYQTLTIYTDNTKVEQLLKRPKQQDYFKYPDVCGILNEYCREKGQNSIEVIRVRGHPTIDEQRQSTIKSQFAKIDRIVRRKTRRYIRKRRIYFKLNYYYYDYYYYYWYQPNPYSYSTYTIFGYHI